MRHAGAGVLAEAPAGALAGIGPQNLLDDVGEATVLKNPAACLLCGQPYPGHEGEPVTGQAPFGIEPLGQAQQAAARKETAVGAHGLQPQALADELLDIEVRLQAQAQQAQLAHLADGLAGDPGLGLQGLGDAVVSICATNREFQAIQTLGTERGGARQT